MAKFARSKGDFLLTGLILVGVGAWYLSSSKRAEKYEDISELASRKAAGQTLTLAEETRLQAGIRKMQNS